MRRERERKARRIMGILRAQGGRDGRKEGGRERESLILEESRWWR
jgi:hypothetical protein